MMAADVWPKHHCILTDLEETENVIGSGAYGAVVEMKRGGKKVAGKKIFKKVLNDNHSYMISKFQKEISRLEQLNHPNIISFLGIYCKNKSDMPMIILEYIPLSLDQFLEESANITNDVRCSILSDISHGVHYLHEQSPPIVLGCFTSKNILLTTGNVAKISDFGVSRIINPDLLQHCKFLLSHHHDQHSIAYIAPEVLISTRLSEDCAKKLDAFSFGNIMLDVFTHKFPTNFSEFICSRHTQNEVQARQHLIDKIEILPIKKLTIQCLDNDPMARPTFAAIISCDAIQSKIHKMFSEAITNIIFSKITELEIIISQSDYKWKHFQMICNQLVKLKQQLADKQKYLIEKIIDESPKPVDDYHETEKIILESSVVQRVLRWIAKKKEEYEKIQKILQCFKGYYSLVNSKEEMQQKINTKYAVCFNLWWEIENDDVEDIFEPGTQMIESHALYASGHNYWYKEKYVVNNLQENIAQFIALAKASDECANVSFVVTNVEKAGPIETGVGNLLLYSKSDDSFSSFVPPGKPNKPIVKEVTGSSATLSCTWNNPEDENYDNVVVLISKQSGKWSQQIHEFDGTKDIVVSGLQPNSTYFLKIMTEYKYGRSETSEICDVKTKSLFTVTAVSDSGESEPSEESDSFTVDFGSGDYDDGNEIDVHCLGRCFQVGNFYDCYNEKLLTTDLAQGVSFENTIQQKLNIKPMTHIITDDSFESKCKALDINDELQLSLLAGLVEAQGASKYLWDFNYSSSNARVTLQYTCITNIATMSPKLLHDIRGRSVEQATHVVSQVLYGLEAFFVFDKHKLADDDGIIEKIVNAIQTNSDTGIGKIYCTPYCEFKNGFPELHTITEVNNVCGQLSTNGQIKSVPVKARLSSLKSFGNFTPMKEIVDIKDDIKSIIIYLKKLSMMICDPYDGKFDVITYKFVRAKQCLSQYINMVIHKACEALPRVRAEQNSEGIVTLQVLLHEHHSSPFSQDRINKWIEKQKQEIEQWLNLVCEGTDNIFPLNSSFIKKKLEERNSKYAVCFELHGEEEDEYLRKASQYVKQPDATKEIPLYTILHETTLINSELRKKLENFNELAKRNVFNKDVTFIITSKVVEAPQVSDLLLYSYNNNEYQPIDMPCKPIELTAERAGCNIKLKWKVCSKIESIVGFDIHYFDTNLGHCSAVCISQDFHNHYNMIHHITDKEHILKFTVPNLQPQTSYSFMVSVKYEYCHSLFSEKSNPVTTKNSPQSIGEPGKPSVARIDPCSVQLRWKKPEMGQSSVKSYIVYWKCSAHVWYTKESFSTAPIMTVDRLSNDSSYVFKVVAKGDGMLSKVSEESEPIKIVDHIPTKPGKPRVRTLSHDSIALTWDEPDRNSDLVAHYLVQVNSDSEPQKILHKTLEKTLMINNFTPNSSYAVMARGDYSISEPSDHLTMTDSYSNEMMVSTINIQNLNPATVNDGQMGLGKPKAIKVKGKKLKLSWEHFKMKAGVEVQTYNVLVWNLDEPRCWMKVSTNSDGKTYTVDELRENTCYKFKIMAVYKSIETCDQSEESNVITTSHEFSEPRELVAFDVTDHTVALKWSAPEINEDLVKKYKIQCKEVCSKKKKIIKSEKNEALIDNLLPKMKYVFKVIAKGDTTEKESEKIEVLTKEQVKPSQPTKPTVSKVTHSSVTLKWSMPEYNTLPIAHYCILYDSLDDFGKLETTDNALKATVDYLKPSITYTFRVIAVCTSNCVSEKSKDSEPITTEAKCCSKPSIPFAAKVAHDSITLMWYTPTTNSSVITHYTIYSHESDKKVKISECTANEHSVVINDLTPSTSYTYSVLANCKSGDAIESSQYTTRTMDTVSGPPGKPELVKVTHNSITVKWSRPIYNDQFITSYEVIYYCLTRNISYLDYPCDEISTINQLPPNCEFRVQVVAECGKKKSSSSCESDTITTKDACSEPGKPFSNDCDITYHSVKLKWSAPKRNTYLIKEYIVTYKSEKDEESHKVQVPVGNDLSSYCHHTIKNLEPVTNYKFKVMARCNSEIFIESEQSYPIKTDKAICSPPGKPTATDTSEYGATIKWTMPQKYPELVQKFKISYIKEFEADYELGSNVWNEVDGPCCGDGITDETCIKQLEPDTSYLFRIIAICGNDEHVISERSGLIRTKPDVCSEPGKPVVDNVTYNKIMLSWNTPEKHQHLVKNYIVTVYDYESGNEVEKRDTPSDKASTVIFNLKPNTRYSVQVVAKCELLVSNSSMSDPILTKQEVCSRPGKPGLSTASHNKITITWAKPTECDHLVQYYNIYYCRCDIDDNWKKTVTSEVKETKEVKSLKPDTEYQFMVQAKCTDGTVTAESEVSDKIKTNKLKLIEELDLKSKLNTSYTEDGKIVFLHLNSPIEENSTEFKGNKIQKLQFNFGDELSQPPAEKVLLLVGATGSGKSTMINGIANYIFGVEWEDDTRIVLISENRKQVESQTQHITSYTFHWQEGFPFPYTLTIIDTPGFGDTRGIKRDREITEQIEQLFKLQTAYGIDQLDGIGFLIHSSSYRLTPLQKYIYDAVLGIFGNDVASNLFIMATFDDGTGNISQLMECLKVGNVNINNVFRFNNGALYTSSPGAEAPWKLGTQSFREFFQVLAQTEMKTLNHSIKVLKERAELRADISVCNAEIQIALQHMQDLSRLQRELESSMLRASKRTNITTRYDVCCVKCKKICDSNCTHFNRKRCFRQTKDERECKVCHCPWEKHKSVLHDKEGILKEQQMRVQENLENIDIMSDQIKVLIERINRASQLLNQIALRPDATVTRQDYIEMLIEKEVDQEKLDHLKMIKSDSQLNMHDLQTFDLEADPESTLKQIQELGEVKNP